MKAARTVWLILGLSFVGEAFVSGPLLLQDRIVSASSRISKARRGTSTARMQEASTTEQAAVPRASSAGGVDIGELSGKRLLVEFAAFGFYERTCQLELLPEGDCVYSKGMITREKGAWRIEEEDGTEYLQFSAPLTEVYSEIFDVPAALLFWRVPLAKSGDGTLVLQGGQIISERKQLFGLRTTFIDEGKFKARVLGDDEEFPDGDVDISDIKVPNGLVARKKRAKTTSSLAEDVPEPPLPADLSS